MRKRTAYILIIIGLILWFIYRDKFGYMDTLYKTDFFVLISVLGFFAAQGEFYRQKLQTPQVISPTVWDSFIVDPQPIGDYMVFRVGGVHMFGLDGDSAFIVPRKELKYNGQTYYTRVRLDKIHKFELPHEIYDLTITQWKLNPDKLYYGEYTLEQEYLDPTLTLKSKVQRLHEFKHNYHTDLFKDVFSNIEKADSNAEEKIKRFNSKPVLEAARDMFNEKILGNGPDDDEKGGIF